MAHGLMNMMVEVTIEVDDVLFGYTFTEEHDSEIVGKKHRLPII